MKTRSKLIAISFVLNSAWAHAQSSEEPESGFPYFECKVLTPVTPLGRVVLREGTLNKPVTITVNQSYYFKFKVYEEALFVQLIDSKTNEIISMNTMNSSRIPFGPDTTQSIEVMFRKKFLEGLENDVGVVCRALDVKPST